jgi:hypothetical protein
MRRKDGCLVVNEMIFCSPGSGLTVWNFALFTADYKRGEISS